MKRRKTLRPVWPNAGIEAAYRRKLNDLMQEVHDSILYWVTAAYRKNEPAVPPLAHDAGPVAELRRVIRALVKRWKASIEGTAPKLAKWFAKSASQRSDKALKKILKDGGFAVEFKLTAAQRDALQGIVAENVSLIKSIPGQYLDQVEQLVMRSVSQGGNLATLSKQIRKSFNVSKKRASLISRDQNSKATSSLTRIRRLELGLNKAVWMHSHAGKAPRPAHVKMHGKEFDVARGMWDPHEKMYIQPGFLINCFPEWTKVHLDTGVRAIWRAPFEGPMVHLGVGADLLEGTFNHPVLTARGWVPLGLVNDSDKVVCMLSDRGGMVDHDKKNEVPTFGQLFEACSIIGTNMSREGAGFDFHGDVPNGEVDQVVIDYDLPFDWKTNLLEDLKKGLFSEPNSWVSSPTMARLHKILHTLGPGLQKTLFVLFGGLIPRYDFVGFGPGAQLHSFIPKRSVYDDPGDIKFFRDAYNAGSPFVESGNSSGRNFMFEPLSRTVFGPDAYGTELFAQFVRIAADTGRSIFDFGPFTYEFRCVTDKLIRDFSGHVFTLQSHTGYYSIGDACIQAKNCRCTSKPVIPGLT